MAQQLTASGFTLGSALSTLLTTESLLFAAFGLTVNLLNPSNRVRAWLIPGGVLAGAIVFAIFVVAFGAAVAWHDIFLAEGLATDGSERILAFSIAGAIVIQPLLAFLLAMGLRLSE